MPGGWHLWNGSNQQDQEATLRCHQWWGDILKAKILRMKWEAGSAHVIADSICPQLFNTWLHRRTGRHCHLKHTSGKTESHKQVEVHRVETGCHHG